MEYNIILNICKALSENKIDVAKNILNTEFVHRAIIRADRNYTEYQLTKLFIRDGFIDRYSGKKLVFPPVLRLLSHLMPEGFPFHKNWKMSDCHIAYWKLFPTVDHIIPIARGGEDNEENHVTTSMLRNSAKSNWLLEELGWELYPTGKLDEWDGLTRWFLEYGENHSDIFNIPYIAQWHKALKRAIAP